MTVLAQTVYSSKKELPLDVMVDAFDLTLYHVAPRKRKVKKISFSGITFEECLEEAKEYKRFYGGRFVECFDFRWPYGYWASCQIKRTEMDCQTFIWKTALLMRIGIEATAIDLGKANS